MEQYKEDIDDEYYKEVFLFGDIKRKTEYIYRKKDDIQHSLTFPSAIYYHSNGNISSEWYYKEGKRHRDEDKPAKIEYYETGEIQKEFYYFENKRHRLNNKPAAYWYKIDGEVIKTVYYEYGKVIPKREIKLRKRKEILYKI